MKKSIVLALISMVIMSAFASASFFEWLRGGNGAQDITGNLVARTAVSARPSTSVASAGTRVGSNLQSVVKAAVSPVSGSRATLRSGQAARSGQSSLSVVSVSNGVATLRYENTMTVRSGQVIEFGGLRYNVLLGRGDMIVGVGSGIGSAMAEARNMQGEMQAMLTLIESSALGSSGRTSQYDPSNSLDASPAQSLEQESDAAAYTPGSCTAQDDFEDENHCDDDDDTPSALQPTDSASSPSGGPASGFPTPSGGTRPTALDTTLGSDLVNAQANVQQTTSTGFIGSLRNLFR